MDTKAGEYFTSRRCMEISRSAGSNEYLSSALGGRERGERKPRQTKMQTALAARHMQGEACAMRSLLVHQNWRKERLMPGTSQQHNRGLAWPTVSV